MKSLTQLVPDFREALEEGLENATEKVVYDLKRDGPYWTGFFESLWEVNAGKRAVRPNVKNPLEVPKQPLTPRYTPVDVPKSENLNGYTIGNRAEYRLYAMDIIKAGPRQAPNARLTADRNWFDTYVNSKMPRVINSELKNVFRRYS